MSKLAGAAKHPLAVVVYVLTAALPGFLEWLEERDTSTEVHLEQKIRDLQEAAIHQNIQANAEDIEALHDQCVTYEDLFTMYDEGSPTRRPVRRSGRRGGGGTGGSRPGASGPQRPGTAAVDGPGEGTAWSRWSGSRPRLPRRRRRRRTMATSSGRRCAKPLTYARKPTPSRLRSSCESRLTTPCTGVSDLES